MTDTELVERASWACGIGAGWLSADHTGDGIWFHGGGKGLRWNPLHDDGDALRLAVALGLNLYLAEQGFVTAGRAGIQGHRVPVEVDAAAAARRAIVLAAADLAP